MVCSNVLPVFVLIGCLSLLNCQSVQKDCKPFSPPKNGASRCIDYGDNLACVVACKDSYDFIYEPANLYLCRNGKWSTWSPTNINDQRLPWPNCSKRNPSQEKMKAKSEFYYKGDCNDPNTQLQLKKDYISILSPPNAPPFFCTFNPQCKAQNVRVYCGGSVAQ